MLIVSPEMRCSNELLSLTAMLSSEFGFQLDASLFLLVDETDPSSPPLLSPQRLPPTRQRSKGSRPGQGSVRSPRRRPPHSPQRLPRLQVQCVPIPFLSSPLPSRDTDLLPYIYTDEHDKNWAYNNFLSQRALQQADNVRTQLKRSMEKHDLDLLSTPFEDKSYYLNIRKALTSGFFMQVAHKEGEKGNYLTIKDNQVSLRLLFVRARVERP